MPPFGPKNPEFSAVSPERQRIRREIAEKAAEAAAIIDDILPNKGKNKMRPTPKVILQSETDRIEGTYTRAWAMRGLQYNEHVKICTDSVRIDESGNVVRVAPDDYDCLEKARLDTYGRIVAPRGLQLAEPEHQLALSELAVDTLELIQAEVVTRRIANA